MTDFPQHTKGGILKTLQADLLHTITMNGNESFQALKAL